MRAAQAGLDPEQVANAASDSRRGGRGRSHVDVCRRPALLESAGRTGWTDLRGRRVSLLTEIELGEVAVGAVRVEVDAGFDAAIEHERVLVELDEARREHRAHERPDGGAQRLLAAGHGVAQLAHHALGSERLGAGHAVGVEEERGAPAREQLGDAVQRVGVPERALQFGVDDRVDLAGFAAAGVADELLALGVGPAGAVGDQFAVVAAQQPADDLAQRAQLLSGRLGQRGADVVAEREVGGVRLGMAGAFCRPAFAVFLGGVTQLAVIQALAGEVGVLARRRRLGVG